MEGKYVITKDGDKGKVISGGITTTLTDNVVYEVSLDNGKYIFEFEENLTVIDKKDAINPEHYPSGGTDWIDFCKMHNVGFIEGNIGKYILRHAKKNGKEDLLKAQEYLNRLIKSYDE